jgi:hypothetical protein
MRGHAWAELIDRSLAPDLAGAITQVGVDPTLESCVLQDALRHAIGTRCGYYSWTVDHA